MIGNMIVHGKMSHGNMIVLLGVSKRKVINFGFIRK